MGDQIAPLAEAVRRSLPRGGRVDVQSDVGDYVVNVTIWHPLPWLRFWRRGRERRVSVGRARLTLRPLLPAHLEARVHWGARP